MKEFKILDFENLDIVYEIYGEKRDLVEMNLFLSIIIYEI